MGIKGGKDSAVPKKTGEYLPDPKGRVTFTNHVCQVEPLPWNLIPASVSLGWDLVSTETEHFVTSAVCPASLGLGAHSVPHRHITYFLQSLTIFCIYLFCFAFTSQSFPSFFSFQSLLSPLQVPFRKRQTSHGYQPVTLRLGTSSPVETEWGNPEGGKGQESRHQSQRQLLLPLLGVLWKDKLCNCHIRAEGQARHIAPHLRLAHTPAF